MDKNLIVWDDVYSVGSSIIDDQHKILINMINDLYRLDADNTKTDSATKAAFAKVFKKAGEYAMTHFQEEEAMLEKAAYPYLSDQKKAHTAFMAKVWDEYSLFNEGKSSSTGMANFLKEWLLNHIAVSDKKYSSYIAK
jgi:hemerythrin